jgi:hypothetical protein
MSRIYDRRNFIKNTTITIVGVTLVGLNLTNEVYSQPVRNKRLIQQGFVDTCCSDPFHRTSHFGIPGVWK